MAGNKRSVSDGNGKASKETKKPVRLLLHAVDGTVPYLTPDLLKKCFPAETVADRLWIGMSVRDTCVAPVFSSQKGKKKSKPDGYTFSADNNTCPDPWLLDYTRVTVPTFDPVQDAIQFSPKKVADNSTLTASSKHVMVWTDNGRQPLTPDLYYNAAAGLKSHATVSLFDVCLSDATQRRRRGTLLRTKDWNSQMVQRQQQHSSTPGESSQQEKWASFLIAPSSTTTEDNGQAIREVEQQRATIQNALDGEKISGVSFIGWQYAADLEQQRELLKKSMGSLVLSGHGSSSKLLNLAVLSTDSLTQFLMTASLGINVIGTNLPAKWAKAKAAFACNYSSWKTFESSTKRPKLEESSLALDENGCFPVLSGNDPQSGKGGAWIRDTRPICPGCSCLTCQRHSRAYIYHLVMTSELLAEILLFIHNLHHTLGLCRELSEALHHGKEVELCAHIQTQLGSSS